MPPESLVELRPSLNSPGDVTSTSSSGFSTGRELKIIWCMREKIAVLAPMPRPNETTTTRVRSGALARLRIAKRMRAISLLFDKQRHRHAESDGDHDTPHGRAPDLSRHPP